MDFKICIDFIEKVYLCAINNKKLIQSCLEWKAFSPMTVDVQDTILNVTVNNVVCKKFPPPSSFQRMFLKNFFNTVEYYGSECSDNLVEMYSKALSEKSDDNEGFYSYKIKEGEVVTLQENSCFVAKSTTGLQTWENSINLENKSILELGSGIGLLGIVALKFCSPCKYMFSDKSWEVLNKLSSNLAINFQNPEELLIEQHQLVWATMSEEEAHRLSPDIVLGADLVYDADMVESLVHALKVSLWSNTSCAYIANTIRNPETNEKFLKYLGIEDLSYEEIEAHEKDIFVYNKSSYFVLYKIFKNKEV